VKARLKSKPRCACSCTKPTKSRQPALQCLAEKPNRTNGRSCETAALLQQRSAAAWRALWSCGLVPLCVSASVQYCLLWSILSRSVRRQIPSKLQIQSKSNLPNKPNPSVRILRIRKRKSGSASQSTATRRVARGCRVAAAWLPRPSLRSAAYPSRTACD
jgi:hypothetical protein